MPTPGAGARPAQRRRRPARAGSRCRGGASAVRSAVARRVEVEVVQAPVAWYVPLPGEEVVGRANRNRLERRQLEPEVLAYEERVDAGQLGVGEPVALLVGQRDECAKGGAVAVGAAPPPGGVGGLH